jgi:KDO2-lipid IV(A) lauroyltransferase
VRLAPRLRVLRFDGLWWRKFAYHGSVYWPDWWKRLSPPWVAFIIFLCAGQNRRGVLRNVRRVHGRQGWLRDHWHALEVFIAFARCLTETLEYFSPRSQPIRFEKPSADPILAGLERGRGAILVTCHFGNWDVAARGFADLGAQVNLVMAREMNETTADYVRQAREDAGLGVLLSDTSVFSPFNMLRALKRNEVVALQLDRPQTEDGSRLIEFFGAPAAFQVGALRLARLAGAPVFPVFVVRIGRRAYQIVLGAERQVPRHAGAEELDQILADIVGDFEALVRRYPDQWFQFTPFWSEHDSGTHESVREPPGAGTMVASSR